MDNVTKYTQLLPLKQAPIHDLFKKLFMLHHSSTVETMSPNILRISLLVNGECNRTPPLCLHSPQKQTSGTIL